MGLPFPPFGDSGPLDSEIYHSSYFLYISDYSFLVFSIYRVTIGVAMGTVHAQLSLSLSLSLLSLGIHIHFQGIPTTYK
jgi:hypothetical protein